MTPIVLVGVMKIRIDGEVHNGSASRGKIIVCYFQLHWHSIAGRLRGINPRTIVGLMLSTFENGVRMDRVSSDDTIIWYTRRQI